MSHATLSRNMPLIHLFVILRFFFDIAASHTLSMVNSKIIVILGPNAIVRTAINKCFNIMDHCKSCLKRHKYNTSEKICVDLHQALNK